MTRRRVPVVVTGPRTGRHGELVPVAGFSRAAAHAGLPPGQVVWRAHDGLVVVSSLERSYLPGSGDPPLVGPQRLVSVSRPRGRDVLGARCQVADADVRRVVDGFAMPAWDEDNHHPGIARHLWCPVDEAWRSACECKVTETTVVDPSGYRWTTDTTAECRGCAYARLFGRPCPLHAPVPARVGGD